jgi:hypothetical protein
MIAPLQTLIELIEHTQWIRKFAIFDKIDKACRYLVNLGNLTIFSTITFLYYCQWALGSI